MKLQISSVADKGVLDKERIILKVLIDADVGNFLLMQTGVNSEDGGVTTHVYQSFWFPWKSVAAGDLVVVYTKSGTNSEKTIGGGQAGRTAHFFYWGLRAPIWNNTNRASVILHAPEWESKTAEEL